MALSTNQLKMQQDGQRLPVEENPEDVRATVFSFVSVRSPQRLLTPADTGAGPAGFVVYDQNSIDSPLYTALAAIKEDVGKPVDKANQMREAAGEALDSVTAAKKQALSGLKDLVSLGSWLWNNQYDLTSAALRQHPAADFASTQALRSCLS